MRHAKRKPNVARLSGYRKQEIPKALASDGQRVISETELQELDSLLDMKIKDLTSYEKMVLRNRGYKIPDDGLI
jgi:hypothetical protein